MARGDTTPVLHATEHAFDDVAPAVGNAVKRIRVPSRAVGRDHDLGSERLEPLTEVVGIISFISQQALRRRDIVEQSSGDADVGDVAGRQDEGDRLALSVGQSVDLAGPSAT